MKSAGRDQRHSADKRGKGRLRRAGVDRFAPGSFRPGPEMQYQLLFEKNPIPMWVVEPASLRFLAINDAAIRQYGYSREEFLAMTLADIRRPEYVEDLLNVLAQLKPGLQRRGTWIHRRKDGSSVEVEIVCQDLDFQGSKALLVAAYDITARNEAETKAR